MEHSGGIVCNPICPKGHNTVAAHRRRAFPLWAHRQRKKRPFIEFRDRFASLIGRKVRIAQGHADCAVTQKITHCVQRNALLSSAAGVTASRLDAAPWARFLEAGRLIVDLARRYYEGNDASVEEQLMPILQSKIKTLFAS